MGVDSKRRTIPITFEKGIDLFHPETLLGSGYTTLCQNFIPDESGNLRCRPGLRNASVTGAPATRQGKGIGFFSKYVGYAAPVRRQMTSGDTGEWRTGNASGPAVADTVQFSQSLQIGSLCLIAIQVNAGGSVSSVDLGYMRLIPGGPTFVGVTGATLVTSKATGTGRTVYLYQVQSVPQWNLTTIQVLFGAGNYNYRFMGLEYLNASAGLDKTASNTGTSVSADAGTTAATSQATELGIAVIDSTNAVLSAPTNGYALVSNQGGRGVLEKVLVAVGAQNTGATVAPSANWEGLIATFKAPFVGTGQKWVMAAHDGGTQYGIYALDRDNIAGGSWTNVENVAVAVTGPPVAFAAGLSKVFYVNDLFATVRSWDGTVAASVVGSPAGKCIAFHKSRLWVGSTAANPTRLWYSNVGDAATWPATNYFEVGQDDAEPIEDIVPFEDGLLIGKRSSLWFLQGSGLADWSLSRLSGGGAGPGRSLCATPHGAVIVGPDAVYLWAGGAVERVSDRVQGAIPLGSSSNYVSVTHVANKAYICDGVFSSPTVWVFDLATGAWWTEKQSNPATDGVVVVGSYANRLYVQPVASVTMSLLAYRDPWDTRQSDLAAALAETFGVQTSQMWLATSERPVTPTHLWVRLRQLGGSSAGAPLVLTPIYDGTALPTISLAPKDGGAQVWRQRIDLGSAQSGGKAQAFGVAFLLQQALAVADLSNLEIEEMVLEIDAETDRR